MDFHGITMKGKYYAEQVTSPTGSDTIGRLVVNTSSYANGYDSPFNTNKLYWNNGTKWVRPIIANADDGPDRDGQWDLGQSTAAGNSVNRRWHNISTVSLFATNVYGAVRYS